jgi:excisionase family DNA binding protein
MNKEIDQTKQVLLKDKPLLSVSEAAVLTGIGKHKLYEMSEDPNCVFVLWNGSKRMFKREKLVQYLMSAYSI